jgi:hypothetical protein
MRRKIFPASATRPVNTNAPAADEVDVDADDEPEMPGRMPPPKSLGAIRNVK